MPLAGAAGTASEAAAGDFIGCGDGGAGTLGGHGHGAHHAVAGLFVESIAVDGADGDAGAIGLADDGVNGVAGIGVGVEVVSRSKRPACGR